MLISAGFDKVPMACKNIREVMAARRSPARLTAV